MDNQRRGACNHIMAVWDLHSLCPGCRDCFLPDNPCRVCEGLTAEQRARSMQARALRLRRQRERQARRAGSAGSVSGSSGPVEGKASGPSGSTPEPSVTRQLGKGLTSPRSVAGSRDGGKGSPSAASPSSVAADDGDAGCITSLGPRSQDGGSGITSLGPRSQDGGSGVRSSYPPLRGAAEALSRQAFRRGSRTPVRLRHSSGSSSDAYAYATVLPTEADRTRTGPDQDRTRTGPDQYRTRTGPGPDRTRTGPGLDQDRTGPGPDRTRTGPGPDRTRTGPGPDPDRTRTGPGMETGTGPGRTRLEAAGSLDQTGTSRSGGMLGMVTAAVVRESEDSETHPCLPLGRRTPTTGENRDAIATVVGTAGADVVITQSPLHRLLRWQLIRFCVPSPTSREPPML